MPTPRVKRIDSEGVQWPWYSDVQEYKHEYPQVYDEPVYNTFDKINDHWEKNEFGEWSLVPGDMPRTIQYDVPWHHMYHSEGDGFEQFIHLEGDEFISPYISTYIPKITREKFFYDKETLYGTIKPNTVITKNDLKLLDIDQIYNLKDYILSVWPKNKIRLQNIATIDE